MFFIVGAALGSFTSGILAERAVFVPCLLLFAAFLMMFWNDEKQGQEL